MIMGDKITFHFDSHIKSCSLSLLSALRLSELQVVSEPINTSRFTNYQLNRGHMGAPMTLDTTPNAYHKWVAETGLLELQGQLQKRLDI